MYMYMYIFIYRQSRTDQSCCFSMTKGLVLILRSHLRTLTHIDALSLIYSGSRQPTRAAAARIPRAVPPPPGPGLAFLEFSVECVLYRMCSG